MSGSIFRLTRGMVLSFMAIGVKEPILVVKMAIADVDVPVVIDGRRRIMHAREANKRLKILGETLLKVPGKPEKGSDEHLAHVSVALNEIRRQDDLLVKAAKAKRMIDRGDEAAAVAVAFGVSKTTVANWLKLGELPAPVQKAINQGVLSAHAASQLHGLERKAQLAKLEELVAQHRQTGKKVSGNQAKAKTGKTGCKKPSKKQLQYAIGQLSQTPDPFMAGVTAGIRYALGEDIPEVKAVVDRQIGDA
jgi:ParB family transcriptional regulator, chromosome partitioning protein